jgi:hypothetical protein
VEEIADTGKTGMSHQLHCKVENESIWSDEYSTDSSTERARARESCAPRPYGCGGIRSVMELDFTESTDSRGMRTTSYIRFELYVPDSEVHSRVLSAGMDMSREITATPHGPAITCILGSIQKPRLEHQERRFSTAVDSVMKLNKLE